MRQAIEIINADYLNKCNAVYDNMSHSSAADYQDIDNDKHYQLVSILVQYPANWYITGTYMRGNGAVLGNDTSFDVLCDMLQDLNGPLDCTCCICWFCAESGSNMRLSYLNDTFNLCSDCAKHVAGQILPIHEDAIATWYLGDRRYSKTARIVCVSCKDVHHSRPLRCPEFDHYVYMYWTLREVMITIGCEITLAKTIVALGQLMKHHILL